MEVNKFRYSIIIPHYNIPFLLRRCLYSIPRRADLQVIVVDDKSSDAVFKELKILEREFDNVTFVYSDINGGGGKARNIGLRYAVGKYILFADADDFFNYCINDILDQYLNTDYDIVYFNANRIDTDTYLPTKRGTTLKRALSLYEKDGNLDAFRYAFGEPWCKLVKREIIEKNSIRFDELSVHNDTKFSYLVGFFGDKVKFDNRALYCLADRTGSVSKGLTDEKWRIRTRVFAEKNRFMADHGIPFFDRLMITPFWNYLRHRDWVNFNRCLSITEEYGFGSFFVVRKLIGYMMRIL